LTAGSFHLYLNKKTEMKKKVLLADFESEHNSHVLTFLNGSNYEVHVATDGVSAKYLLPRVEFDLVIMEIMLPKIDGIQLAKFINGQHPLIRKILISGFYKGSNYKYNFLRECHADFYFEKPVAIEQLQLALVQLFPARRADPFPAADGWTGKLSDLKADLAAKSIAIDPGMALESSGIIPGRRPGDELEITIIPPSGTLIDAAIQDAAHPECVDKINPENRSSGNAPAQILGGFELELFGDGSLTEGKAGLSSEFGIPHEIELEWNEPGQGRNDPKDESGPRNTDSKGGQQIHSQTINVAVTEKRPIKLGMGPAPAETRQCDPVPGREMDLSLRFIERIPPEKESRRNPIPAADAKINPLQDPIFTCQGQKMEVSPQKKKVDSFSPTANGLGNSILERLDSILDQNAEWENDSKRAPGSHVNGRERAGQTFPDVSAAHFVRSSKVNNTSPSRSNGIQTGFRPEGNPVFMKRIEDEILKKFQKTLEAIGMPKFSGEKN
jgi:CheY-like chemotaxis protein